MERRLLVLHGRLRVQLVRLVGRPANDGRLCVVRQLISWGKATIGKPRSDGGLIFGCVLMGLETRSGGGLGSLAY